MRNAKVDYRSRSKPPSGSCRLLADPIERPTSIPTRCSCHKPSHCVDPVCSARSHLVHGGCTCLVLPEPRYFGRPTCYTPSCCCTHRSTRSSCPRASSQRSRAANCNRSPGVGMSSSAAVALVVMVLVAAATAVVALVGRQPSESAPSDPPSLGSTSLSSH